jgi:hypothetical protein
MTVGQGFGRGMTIRQISDPGLFEPRELTRLANQLGFISYGSFAFAGKAFSDLTLLHEQLRITPVQTLLSGLSGTEARF